MDKINKIYIDGFRNIINTSLRFTQPLTTLLALNNYGKTNVINAIELAANLICMGTYPQGDTISKNGYVSYNKDNSNKPFTFEINATKDNKVINYGFKISPNKGVHSEVLSLGNNPPIINRAEGRSAIVGDTVIPVPHLNLLISRADQLSSNEETNHAADIASSVQELFYSIISMQCNRKPQLLNDFTNIENSFKSNEIKLTNSLVKWSLSDPAVYDEFKRTFLRLFQCIDDIELVKLRLVQHGIDSEENDEYNPHEYKLAFFTRNKRKHEVFDDLSAGTQDILMLLREIFSKRNSPLIAIEEIENGIHPSLYRKVLQTLQSVCKNTKILITTHSPSIVRHFGEDELSSLYIGVPAESGDATFATIRESKKDEIQNEANNNNTSVGELIFDMLADSKNNIGTFQRWLDTNG